MSFENESCAKEILKDGSPFPPQKDFEDSSFDKTMRTFTGTIRWDDNPCEGLVKDKYEFKFSEDW